MFAQHCPACGYDLTGLLLAHENLCPECGGRVDPDQFRLKDEAIYKRKVVMFALAGAAPWLGPVAALVGSVAGPLAESLDAVGVVVGIGGPIAGVCLLYAAFRLDHRQEHLARSPWGDLIPSLLLMALYTLCVWAVIGVVALMTVHWLK